MKEMNLFGKSVTNKDDRGKVINKMKYEYMKLNDGTQIMHSQTYRKNNIKCVDVYFEVPAQNCLNTCCIQLPTLIVKENLGYSEDEVEKLKVFAKHDASAFFAFGDEECDYLA